MFGNGLKQRTKETPQWAWDIVKQVKNDYNIYIYDIHWHNGSGYGCYYPYKKVIEIYSPQEKTDYVEFVLYHELSHSIHDQKIGGDKDDKFGKRYVHHGPEFWCTAAEVYKKYGILEYAAKKEPYKRGRKYLQTLVCNVTKNTLQTVG